MALKVTEAPGGCGEAGLGAFQVTDVHGEPVCRVYVGFG